MILLTQIFRTDRFTAAASTRVLEYSSTNRVVNYSSNFLLLEYSLISISGCKFPFPVAVCCSQSTILVHSIGATCRHCGAKNLKKASELLKYRRFALRAMLQVTILTLTHQCTTPFLVIGSLYSVSYTHLTLPTILRV